MLFNLTTSWSTARKQAASMKKDPSEEPGAGSGSASGHLLPQWLDTLVQKELYVASLSPEAVTQGACALAARLPHRLTQVKPGITI